MVIRSRRMKSAGSVERIDTFRAVQRDNKYIISILTTDSGD
jgi:hypothetical protein